MARCMCVENILEPETLTYMWKTCRINGVSYLIKGKTVFIL